VSWRAADVASADLAPLLEGADVVVSCIGVIGGSDAYMEAGNGDVNVKVSHTASPRFSVPRSRVLCPERQVSIVRFAGTACECGQKTARRATLLLSRATA
jgi:hypothetical protein